MPRRSRFSRGRFGGNGFFEAVRDHPRTSAAVAAGAAGAAAAGAFLWSRRDRIGEAFSSGMDRLSELRAERMHRMRDAPALKETGKKSRGPRGPIVQQDIKAGMAS